MPDRLISADALKKLIANHVYPVADAFNNRDNGMFWTGGIEKAIDEVPTVDAVEVVRCKDCVYFWDGVCTAHTDAICTDENEFCSWGERR